MTNSSTPGQFRHPFIEPQAGHALWAVWCKNHQAAHTLCEGLLRLSVPPVFDVETWTDDKRALILVEEPLCQSAIVWRKLLEHGEPVAYRARLDITGTLTPGRKALEVLQ